MDKLLIKALLIALCMCGVSLMVVATQNDLGTSGSQEETYGHIKLEYYSALADNDTKPYRIVFYQPVGGGTRRDARPGRLVIYGSSGHQQESIVWQCYRDDIFLKYADLLQYYRVTKIELTDIDDDGIDEAVISWDSYCMGSGSIQTLEVLDYDPETAEFRSYRGATASGPFGGFLVDSLDPDGSVQGSSRTHSEVMGWIPILEPSAVGVRTGIELLFTPPQRTDWLSIPTGTTGKLPIHNFGLPVTGPVIQLMNIVA